MGQGLEPPAGYIGTPEASELLHVHPQTIRNYVKDGKLEGKREFDADTRRERYWVKREAVEALAQDRPHEDAVERADIATRRTEEVVEEIGGLQSWLEGKLSTIEQNQNDMLEELKRGTEILEETGRRSREFQDQMLELKDAMIEIIEEERQHLREKHHHGGFWRRILGLSQD